MFILTPSIGAIHALLKVTDVQCFNLKHGSMCSRFGNRSDAAHSSDGGLCHIQTRGDFASAAPVAGIIHVLLMPITDTR